MLLTEHLLEILSLKGGCTGSSESTLVKKPHCWKSHYERGQRSGIDTIKHLTNGKETTSQLDITNESQEVSPFPAGVHKATINRRARKHSKYKTELT